MTFWQIFSILGIVFLILELLAPTVFFFSLSIGAFVSALVSLFVPYYQVVLTVFAIVSLVSLLLFRPFLRKNSNKSEASGIEDKYIGKTAKVLEKVTKCSGVISIYGERWEARLNSDDEVPEGCEVKIVSNQSLVMYVEKM